MKERGKVFKTEEVKAILDGRKTMFRVPVKVPSKSFYLIGTIDGVARFMHKKAGVVERIQSPFGVPGDRIYVRETWNHSFLADDDVIRNREYVYFADGYYVCTKWRPSIHMPREAARLFLEITDVRVERVRDISEEDAVKEGIFIQSSGYYCWHADYALNDSACNAKTAYKKLYESIYGPDSWEKDWVWVYKFKVL